MQTATSQKPKLLDQVRNTCRLRQYSIRTEQAYTHWAKKFILYHGKRHPLSMGKPEIEAFLTHLAVDMNVSASTQIYTHVLNRPGLAVRSPLDG